MKELNWWKC